MASISSLASNASLAICTIERAGGRFLKTETTKNVLEPSPQIEERMKRETEKIYRSECSSNNGQVDRKEVGSVFIAGQAGNEIQNPQKKLDHKPLAYSSLIMAVSFKSVMNMVVLTTFSTWEPAPSRHIIIFSRALCISGPAPPGTNLMLLSMPRQPDT